MLSLERVAQRLEETLTHLDILEAEVVQQAEVWMTSPFKMMKSDGQPALRDIVIARAQALAAYTSIQVDIRVQERFRKQQEDAHAEAARQARLREGY